MRKRENEKFQWLEFELLQKHKNVVHAVFLRSLDFKKRESSEIVCEFLELDQLIQGNFVHGDCVEVVPCKALGKCDGLITKKRDLGLLVTHADCQAAIFYDPIQKVIANIHCGWRGNVLNIYEKTIKKLEGQFCCLPENLIVCISPSLGPAHSEFVNYKTEFPKAFLKYQFKPLYFDLWQIAKDQLQSAGVLPHHIEIARQCTFSNEQWFFSHRRDKKTGRNGTLVALKS